MKKTFPAIISVTAGFILFAAHPVQALDLPVTPGPFVGTTPQVITPRSPPHPIPSKNPCSSLPIIQNKLSCFEKDATQCET